MTWRQPVPCPPIPRGTVRFRCPPWRERGYHGFCIRNHLILYRIDAREHTIHVARVFHATQDWVSRLDSLP